jgi:hypothetical protein
VAQVSTEGRVFAAQLTRDLVAREAAGAGSLSPGHKHWLAAFHGFVDEIAKAKGPVHAAKLFKAGLARLHRAQNNGACFVNAHMIRSRSGGFEVLVWEVDKHPLMKSGHEGIIVRGYHCTLQRGGCIRMGRAKLAFISWHALGRIRERSKVDLFESLGVVAGCGFAGRLMQMSKKHANTGLHYATAGTLLCAGILRTAQNDNDERYCFFDVITAFQPQDGPQAAQWKQGAALALAVHAYVEADDADPEGYANDIEVLPPRSDDYVSRELKRAS